MINKAAESAPVLKEQPEKRRAQRLVASWKVTYKMADGIIRKSQTRDVSTTGCSFSIPKAIPSNQKVFIRIHAVIKGLEFNIDAIALSRHSSLANNEFICGFEFSKISDNHTNVLKAYVTKASSEKFELLKQIEKGNA